MVGLPEQLVRRVRAFDSAVSKRFADLRDAHGFTRGEPRVRDVGEPRDAVVSIRFSRSDLVISIGMALYHDRCGLVIRDPNWYRKPRPRIKAITLDDLTTPSRRRVKGRDRLGGGPLEAGIDAEVQRLASRFQEVKGLLLAQGGSFFAQMPMDPGEGKGDGAKT